jgi:hypothetical protein
MRLVPLTPVPGQEAIRQSPWPALGTRRLVRWHWPHLYAGVDEDAHDRGVSPIGNELGCFERGPLCGLLAAASSASCHEAMNVGGGGSDWAAWLVGRERVRFAHAGHGRVGVG